MKHKALLLAVAILLLPTALAAAQAGSYDLAWWTVDGGSGVSGGGDYALSGTAGQPDAGAHSSGDYALAGGFWSGVEAARKYHTYLPVVLKPR